MFTKIFKIQFFMCLLAVSFFIQQVNSQISQMWASRYNNGSTDKCNAMAVDAAGNVYVTGTSGPFGTEDIATIKYSTSGALLWLKRFNGTAGGSDYGNSIAVDAAGNVYVTGKTWTSTSSFDIITIKYNSAGDTVWTKRYNGPRNGIDAGNSICVDAAGNVYVTGQEEGTVGTHGIFENYITLKYNSAGAFLWGASYNGPGGDYDAAYSIVIDGTGNVYVTGESGGGSGGSGLPYQDYATIKYNSSGVMQWVKRYNASGNGDDAAKQVKVDLSGNVYVTGRCTQTASYYDYATIKYNSAGTEQWVKIYTSTGSATDEANSLAIDRAGNVFVTGKSWGGANKYDIVTIKYNTAGTEVWNQRFNGLSNDNDAGTAIVLDTSSNAFVTGYSTNPTTGDDYETIKYNSAGVQEWEIRYTNGGAAGSSDQAVSIFADNSGNVYVSGMSALDYAVVKYAPLTGITNNNEIPSGFELKQNFPNPFNPSTTIEFNIAENNFVSLKVYDIQGREVQTLVNENLNKGSYSVSFNATSLSSGTYFYKLVTTSFTDVKKMMLVK